jgi:NADH-quinone oxidoreductase subunit G
MLGATGGAPLKAIVLLNVEPALDPRTAPPRSSACHSAEMVVVLSPFKDAGADVADVMLPVAPFTETSGTYVSAEGRVQGVHGVVKPLRDTRPAWKVLRVLGNLLGLEGFTFESPDEVRDEALGSVDAIPGRLSNRPAQSAGAGQGKRRRVRRARAHRRRADLRDRQHRAPRAVAAAHGRCASAARAPVARPVAAPRPRARRSLSACTQGSAEAVLPAAIDATLAATAVRFAAGHRTTAGSARCSARSPSRRPPLRCRHRSSDRAATAALGSGTA